MKIEDMLLELHIEGRRHPNRLLIDVFFEVFGETDEIKLLQKRALVINSMQKILQKLGYEEDTLDDTFKVLSFDNLRAKIGDLRPSLTTAHQKLIVSIFKHYKSKEEQKDISGILQANDELKESLENEDITEEQKEVLLQICCVVDEVKINHELVGSLALDGMLELIMGKTAIYKDIISSIESIKVKEKLGNLYQKVVEANNFLGFLISAKENLTTLIGWVS